MKRILWLGFALFFLRALSADVVLKKPGQKVMLPCGLDTYRNTLMWRHQDTMVIRVDRTGLPKKGSVDLSRRSTVRKTTLEIQNVKETDAGMFTCTADGDSKQHFLFLITVSASPSTVLQLGSSATLQCQVKGLPSQAALQWRKPDGSLHPGSDVARLEAVACSDEGAWNCTFSHGGLVYSERLDIKVTDPATTPAKNVPSDQDKEAATCNDCVTSSPSLLRGLSWWMWTAIGVGCLVLTVLTAIIIHLYKRIQRKKRKAQSLEKKRRLLMPKQYCQCNRPTAVPKLQARRQRPKPSSSPRNPLPVQ